MRTFVFICYLIFLYGYSYGQNSHEFTGQVVNESHSPLQGAYVMILDISKGTVTDAGGKFSVDNLTENSFKIEISYLGYKTLRKTISLKEKEDYIFQLELSSVKLDDVVISDNYSESRKRETSLNVEVINDDFLKQNLGGSLMKSLERLPGVSTIDIGAGQSKPVIRGLGFNRVVVVENDIKHESQQWGADHGLEIDQYAVENIEIVKGPASLMYGSDAIGGVIDMKDKGAPLENSFGGSVDFSGKTNNDFLGTSISLHGRKKSVFASARFTLLDYGDYRVPTDEVAIYSFLVPLDNNHLRNTAGNEKNLHATFGIIKDQFQSKINVSSVNTKGGFFANAHGLAPLNVNNEKHDSSSRDLLYPFHKVNHFKIINRSKYWSDTWGVEFALGYQRNFREEWSQYSPHGYMPPVFPESSAFNQDIERQFDKDIYSANTKHFVRISDKTILNSGINSEYLDNNIGGRGFIIPAFQQFSLGSYVIAKHNLSDKSLLQAGIRYDYGNINIENHNDWFLSPITDDSGATHFEYLERSTALNRDFSNFSWSVGYNYNTPKWSYKLNIGKSFRMPIAKELGANGVNYHRFSYEVGNADLSPEISYQFDGGMEYSHNDFAIGVSPFVNYFSNYLFLNPTSRFDRLYGFGNQVFEYVESEVFRFGGEIHAHYKITNSIQFGLIGEYVYAEQLSGEKKGFTLPFAPPASAIVNMKYQKPKLAFVNNGYLSLDSRFTAAQNNIVPPEVATDGFQAFNLSLGGDLLVNNQKMDVSIQIQNLMNTKYFNHTSYYRLINVPEPGRNIVINISIPFAVKLKEN